VVPVTAGLKITFADWDGMAWKNSCLFSSKPAVDWMKNMGMNDGKMVSAILGRVFLKTLLGIPIGPGSCRLNNDDVPDLIVGRKLARL